MVSLIGPFSLTHSLCRREQPQLHYRGTLKVPEWDVDDDDDDDGDVAVEWTLSCLKWLLSGTQLRVEPFSKSKNYRFCDC